MKRKDKNDMKFLIEKCPVYNPYSTYYNGKPKSYTYDLFFVTDTPIVGTMRHMGWCYEAQASGWRIKTLSVKDGVSRVKAPRKPFTSFHYAMRSVLKEARKNIVAMNSANIK